MSALSNVISTAIEGAANRAIRRAIPGGAGGVLAPVIDKAIDQIRGSVLGRQPDKKFREQAAIGGASNRPGDSFAGIHARGDALQNWCWYALMPTVNNNGYTTELPWQYVQSGNLPERNITPSSTNFAGHPVHFPESYNVDNLQLGMFMDDTNSAQRYVQAWRELVLQNGDSNLSMGAKGLWGLPAKYKMNIDIVVLNMSKTYAINFKYTGCWPTTSSQQELTSGAGEAMVKTVNFMVEDVFIDLYDLQGVVEPTQSPDQSGYTTGLTGAIISSALNKLEGLASAII